MNKSVIEVWKAVSLKVVLTRLSPWPSSPHYLLQNELSSELEVGTFPIRQKICTMRMNSPRCKGSPDQQCNSLNDWTGLTMGSPGSSDLIIGWFSNRTGNVCWRLRAQIKQLDWPMTERQIGYRKSNLVLSARLPVVKWRSRPVAKSA